MPSPSRVALGAALLGVLAALTAARCGAAAPEVLAAHRHHPPAPPTSAPTRNEVNEPVMVNGLVVPSCPLTYTTSSSIEQCAGGTAIALSTYVAPSADTVVSNCTSACVLRYFQGQYERGNYTCVGFTVINETACTIAACPASAGIGALTPAPPKHRKHGAKINPKLRGLPTAYVASSACFETEKIPVCSNPSLSALNSYSFDPFAFQAVVPDIALCELVQLAGPFGTQYQTVNQYTCSLAACLRWCQWDSQCQYVMYSATQQQCTIATQMQITDAPNLYQAYWEGDFQVFMRAQWNGGQFAIPYYSGKCNEEVRATCNADKECHWDKGQAGYGRAPVPRADRARRLTRRGRYNRQTMGGFENGYCGRVRCIAYGQWVASQKGHGGGGKHKHG